MNQLAEPLEQKRDVRRENLRALIRLHGHKQLSLMLKVSESRLSHLAGPNPTRPITEKVATRFEHRLGIADGWLSEPREYAVDRISSGNG